MIAKTSSVIFNVIKKSNDFYIGLSISYTKIYIVNISIINYRIHNVRMRVTFITIEIL